MSPAAWSKIITLNLLCVLVLISMEFTWRFTNKPIVNTFSRTQNIITPGQKMTSHVENVIHMVPHEERSITQLVLETTKANRTITTRKGIYATEDKSIPITSYSSKCYFIFQLVSYLLILTFIYVFCVSANQ